MKLKKNHALRMLSLLLCLLLTVAAVPMAGIVSVSAGAEEGIYLRGNMNGWNCYDEYKFVDEGGGIYTLVLDMTGGNYEYKIGTPTWSVGLGDPANNSDNAHLVIEGDSIVKFTANLNTYKQSSELMNTKSDFTVGDSPITIEVEKYTFALGAVSVISDSKASAGKYVGDFGEGDSLNYGITVSGNEAKTFRFTVDVASATDDGNFIFTAGNNTSYANFISTGNWQTYKTMMFTKTLEPGYNRITIENTYGTFNVDKLTVEPLASHADSVAKGESVLTFDGFDSASDTNLVKDGAVKDAKEGDYVSVIVKPEQDGVYTLALDDAATAAGNVMITTEGKYADVAVIDEETPSAEFVIDGETEIFVSALENGVNVDSIKLTYIENVEQMGYLFMETGFSGVRFANTFAVSEIEIFANTALEGAKLAFSDGTAVDVESVEEGGTVVVTLDKAKNVTWVKLEAEGAEDAMIQVKGVKDSASATDIALDGYVSTPYGWDFAINSAYTEMTATEGKVGFGFDKEVTVNKVVFVGIAGNEFIDDTTSQPATEATEPTGTDSTEPTGTDSSDPVASETTTTDSTVASSTAAVDVTYLLGDSDGDGKISIKDTTTIQKAVAKLITLDDAANLCADVNADSTVNIKDATAIQKHLAKYDTGYAIGEMVTANDEASTEAQLVAVAAAAPVAVTGADAPVKATLTTADNKTVELTGTVVGNDVVFEIEDAYSFGFYFDFGQEITVNAIQVYGDTAYKGGSVNVSDEQDYTLFVNGLTENDSRVIANTGTHILTSETGSDREWYPTVDTGDSPVFYAPNTPLAEAAYNLTMEEIYKSINYDETFGDVFYTGTNWHKVWTRDTAISMQYVLSWLFPEISTNCAEAKVVGKDGNLTFEEDTGTGGSYPVSTDRIIMMLAVWETYLADGNEETLEYFYNVASNTIEQDYEVVYDAEAGLFRGETCGLDHRDKTYGDWTGEDDENGIVTIAEGKAASTNIIFCQVMKILSEAALILDKPQAESDAWADLAADLETAISTRLWHEDLGTYASWEYPDWMGSPLSYKQDVLANGYAVWYNIGTEEQVNSIMENHTLVPFGANTVYPQKNAARWTDYKYHDSGVWPGWEALLMVGAVNNENENNLLAEEIWNSCVRGAVACLTNYEVIDYETGEGLHSTQQLWSVAATMAGYYRVLFGMEYTTEGITFDPYIPDWMEGPFTISGLKYRDATLTVDLYGEGDTVESIYVNGEQVANDYVFPVDAQGEYNIVINVVDSGAEDIINLKADNTAKAPTAPNATLTGTTLKWNTVAGCTYKVWTGTEYVDVDGTTYTIDDTAYGVYSVVAVDKTTGLWSELSKPLTYSPAGSNVTVNVGDASNTSTFTVNIPVDGTYQLSAIHTNQGDPTAGITAAIRSVYVDGEDVGTLVFPAMSFGHQVSSHLRLDLTAGTHEVTVKYATENWYDRNMSQAHGQNNNNVTFHMFQFTLTDGDFSQIEPPAKKTIYFSNNKNWSKVNIFFWGGADSTTWPGEAMEYVGLNENGEQVYKYQLDPSTTQIIFNNGSEQTSDITENVVDNKGFYLTEQVDGKWNVGTYDYSAE